MNDVWYNRFQKEGDDMGTKQTEWTRAYNEKAYDRLAITIPKGRKTTIEAAAREHGESINGFVNALLRGAVGLTEQEWKEIEA